MKKLFIVLMLAALVVAAAACAAQEPVVTEAPGPDPVTGGWTVPTAEAAAIPEDVQAAFDAAMEDIDGVGYVPVAYLGSQMTGGVNYVFLCRGAAVTTEPVVSLNTVLVRVEPDGTAAVQEIREVRAADYVSVNNSPVYEAAVDGGWCVEDAVGAALSEDAQKAFDLAVSDLTGVGYTPLACLGTQVVAGTNYAVLCRGTMVTAEPASALAVLVIYADLSGNAEISNIAAFSIQ